MSLEGKGELRGVIGGIGKVYLSSCSLVSWLFDALRVGGQELIYVCA